MEKLRIDIEDLNDLITLSCVENYVMAFLKKSGFQVSLLYGESYLSIDKILYKFYIENVEYAYFNGIPRLHDVAKKYGIIELEGYSECGLDSISFSDWYVLMEIKPEALLEMYGSQAWRKDHFIYLDKEEENFFYINNNPRDARVISKTRISEMLCSRAILFRLKEQLSEDKKSDIVWNCLNLFQQEGHDLFDLNEIDFGDLVQFRDFLGVLRVSRKRLGAFIANFENDSETKEYLLELDKLYMRIEYQRMRKKAISNQEYRTILNDLKSQDMQTKNKIITVLQNII